LLNFVEIWDFKYLNFLIKSRIHTIKQHKKFSIFLKTIAGKIEKKKDVKNTKKLKKKIVSDGIFENILYLKYLYFFHKN